MSGDKGMENKVIGEPKIKEKFYIFFNGKNSEIKIGENVEFHNSRLKLYNNSSIVIKDGGYIRGTLFAHDNSSISIGQRCRINGNLNISALEGTSVIIGDDCLISEAVVKSSDMHSIYDCGSNQRINFAKDVRIGDRVWIGDGVIILKGVKIGNDSIIGARSVVTKDVPSNVIVAGNPARIIKTNVYWFKK